MECKEARGRECGAGIRDLIETLWNVKITWSEMDREELVDLIETLWNVKEEGRKKKDNSKAQDLIETLWNVKKMWLLKNNKQF